MVWVVEVICLLSIRHDGKIKCHAAAKVLLHSRLAQALPQVSGSDLREHKSQRMIRCEPLLPYVLVHCWM